MLAVTDIVPSQENIETRIMRKTGSIETIRGNPLEAETLPQRGLVSSMSASDLDNDREMDKFLIHLTFKRPTSRSCSARRLHGGFFVDDARCNCQRCLGQQATYFSYGARDVRNLFRNVVVQGESVVLPPGQPSRRNLD